MYEAAVSKTIEYTNVIESLKQQLTEVQNMKPQAGFDKSGLETAEELAERMKSHIQQMFDGTGRIENPVDIAGLTDEQFAIFQQLKQDAFSASQEIADSFSKLNERITQSFSALSENVYNKEAVTATFGEAAGSIRNYAQAVEQLGERAGQVLNESAQLDFNTGGTGKLKKPLEDLQDAAAKAIDPIRKLKAAFTFHDVDESGYDRLKSSLRELIHMVLSGTYSIKDFFAAFKENPISVSASAIMNVADKMFSVIRSAIDSSGNALERLGESFGNVLGKIRGVASEIRSAIGSMTDGAMEKLAGFAGSIINTVLHPFQTLKSIAGAAINGVAGVTKNALGSAFDWIRDKAAGLASIIINAIAHPFQTVKSVAGAAMKAVKAGIERIIPLLQKVGSAIKKFAVAPFKLMGSAAKKAFSSIGKSTQSSNNMFGKGFKNILKYGLGIRSVYALINKLRTAIKEGFKNLAQYSVEVNTSISMLKGSLETFKNASAAALSPLLNAMAPALNAIIQLCICAANAVNQLLSALFGKGTWIKAKDQIIDYAASMDKAGGAAKKLKTITLGIDELNINAPDDGGAGGGSGTETSAEDMFETLPIDEKFKDWSEKIKSMWQEADFTDLGASIGEQLKNALDNIPWDSIKDKAGKIGSSLAALINGVIKTGKLGYTIGSTLAQAVNTGFAFLNSFVHEVHADSVGKFLAETINGITQSIEWDVIYDTFTTAAHKIAELVNNFFSPENLDYESISSTISNLVNTIVDSLYILIMETEWADIGESFGKTLSDAWAGIDWGKAGETVGEAFKAFFDFIGNAIKAVDWQEVGRSVKDFLVGIDWADVAESFFEAVGAAVGGLAGFLAGLFEGMGDDIVNGLLFGISDKLGDIANWIWEHVFTPFINGFKEAFGIHSPSTVMEEMGTYIIEGLFNGITSLIDSITETWESMKTTALEIWDSIKDSLSKTWDNIKKTATDVFEGLKKSISGIWEGLWTNIKGTINSILGGVEGMANGVVNGVNSVIRAMNNLKFDIPDWIPGMGGKTFGFNIPELGNISIPKLAAGGIVTQYTPAVIGEAGMEAVLPLTNRRTMGMIADSIFENTGYGQGGFNGDVKNMIREAVHEELPYLMGALAPYLGDISQNTREAADKDMSFSLDGREFISAIEGTGERLGFNFRSGGSRSRGMF